MVHFGVESASKELTSITPSFGVGGNTLRAYGGWPLPPSEVYRAWARYRTRKITKSISTVDISSQERFDKWHTNLGQSLNAKWKRDQGGKLTVAYRYKLVDLYIKWLSGYNLPRKVVTSQLNAYAYCPLDSQTLSKINACYSYCLPLKKPSMGDIQTENAYRFCQEIITEFCSQAGGTRLEFDYWVWKRGG